MPSGDGRAESGWCKYIFYLHILSQPLFDSLTGSEWGLVMYTGRYTYVHRRTCMHRYSHR